MSLSLSHWYPGSGVILDCIDSFSLHPYFKSRQTWVNSICQLPTLIIQETRYCFLLLLHIVLKAVYRFGIVTCVCILVINGEYSGLEVIKLFPCSTQLSMKFILLIKVKMPTIVGILTFISRINTTYESLKARNSYLFQHFIFYEHLKFHAQLS